MSLAPQFEALAAYGAAVVRVVPRGGPPEEQTYEGRGLQEAMETLGQRPLLEVLADGAVQEVHLEDGSLRVRAERNGTGARMVVAWDDQVVVDEHVSVPGGAGPWFVPDEASRVGADALLQAGTPLVAVQEGAAIGWFTRGTHGPGAGQRALRALIPEVRPESLGSAAFRAAHGVRWAYVAGAMAGGIASADLVIAMARAGMLGFFGAGGVPLPVVEEALKRIPAEAGEGVWGFNLLHNPSEPAVEEQTVDLYLAHGVKRVSASAFMGLTPAVVRYRLTGIHEGPDGLPVCPNHVFAKISRPEVAEHFLRPAPAEMVAKLVEAGVLSRAQAELARRVPIAADITAEADSGGHTDHRPFSVIVPSMLALRDRIALEEGYAAIGIHPRVGAAGGIGTPQSVHAAFSMGADYVLTGSVNQATVEAGTSPIAKEMLAAAGWWEVASGPAPDMFEIGAKVQVLSRGSMYAQRAQRLYDLYRSAGSLDAIPDKDRKRLETQFFKRSIEDVWQGTRDYWAERDPRQVERAEADPRHKMALTFRWYLGMTSRWARTGEEDRKRDYQVWCGPAMGAFNEWVAGSALEPVTARTVVGVARALMEGAAALSRVSLARTHGLPVPNPAVPRPSVG